MQRNFPSLWLVGSVTLKSIMTEGNWNRATERSPTQLLVETMWLEVAFPVLSFHNSLDKLIRLYIAIFPSSDLWLAPSQRKIWGFEARRASALLRVGGIVLRKSVSTHLNILFIHARSNGTQTCTKRLLKSLPTESVLVSESLPSNNSARFYAWKKLKSKVQISGFECLHAWGGNI